MPATGRLGPGSRAVLGIRVEKNRIGRWGKQNGTWCLVRWDYVLGV